MKNRLSDLNNHLFAEIERLGDEELTPDQIATESKRALAIVQVADKIISNASLQLKTAELLAEYGQEFESHLPEIKKPEKQTLVIRGPKNGL